MREHFKVTAVKKPSLLKSHPEIAAQAVGWDPKKYTAESKERLSFHCFLHSITYISRITYRVIGIDGCHRCEWDEAFAKPDTRKVSHWTLIHPEIAAQADNWDPKRATNGSNVQRNWICSRQHHFKLSVAKRIKFQAGCNKCGKWRPRNIFIWELADELFIDRVELWRFAKETIKCKLDMRKKISIANAEKIVDSWYDQHSVAPNALGQYSRDETDWGHGGHERFSINERCSSCEAMIDPQRPHECRNY